MYFFTLFLLSIYLFYYQYSKCHTLDFLSWNKICHVTMSWPHFSISRSIIFPVSTTISLISYHFCQLLHQLISQLSSIYLLSKPSISLTFYTTSASHFFLSWQCHAWSAIPSLVMIDASSHMPIIIILSSSSWCLNIDVKLWHPCHWNYDFL